jgi:hypothetical protein
MQTGGDSNGGETMTDEQLAEIEARCAAASPGPWDAIRTISRPEDGAFLVYKLQGRGGWNRLMRVVTVTNPKLPAVPPVDEARITRLEDAVFCSHAREDVPALLAEVRRLRAELVQANGGTT